MSSGEDEMNRAYLNQTMIYAKINQTKMNEIKKKIFRIFPRAVL